MFGLQVAAASTIFAAQSLTLVFNALFDGTLGDMPAMRLVIHGTLAFLNSTKTSLTARSETSSSPATTSSAPANRDKEIGAVVGAFIGAALTAPIKI